MYNPQRVIISRQTELGKPLFRTGQGHPSFRHARSQGEQGIPREENPTFPCQHVGRVHPVGRIVIPGNGYHRPPSPFGQPVQRAIQQLDCFHGRVKGIEQITRHHDGIHRLLIGHPDNLVHHQHLFIHPFHVIQSFSQMPIRSM